MDLQRHVQNSFYAETVLAAKVLMQEHLAEEQHIKSTDNCLKI